MKQKFGDYYLGLDIGTNSVGWAVTDENYNILDFKNKAMWGCHLFNEGNAAQERRTFRTARRRKQRRSQRIALLRELFEEEISKVDPMFFQRLDDSHLHIGDFNKDQSNSLFNEKGFTDKDYQKRFPTIYHLRRDLINTKKRPDIRLIYLAIHNILKHRGHFLFSGLGDGKLPDFNEVFELLRNNINIFENIDIDIPSDIEKLKNTLSDKSLGVRDRGSEVIDLLFAETPEEKEFSKLISGSKVDIGKIFDPELKDIKISLSDGSFDDVFLENEDAMGSDVSSILQLCKQVYDWSVLSSLLKGFETVYEAKIEEYDQHKKDLILLKNIVKKHLPEEYDSIFKSNKTENNYCAYSKNFGDKVPEVKFTTQEDFCKFILGKFKSLELSNEFDTEDMMARLKNGTFMPKQKSKDNSTIPYNLHYRELDAILENASKFYPFLNDKDESDLSVKEKILLIDKFRIPYYVGPIDSRANHFWAARKSYEKMTPWNFENIIDLDKSSENFIKNLINACTYLPDEEVLPKNSLLYSEYMVYNEINPIKINGEAVPTDIKNKMIQDLFINSESIKNITKKAILNYFVLEGKADKSDEITGIDDTVKSNLRSYKKLKEIIGDKVNDTKMSENIVIDITIFGDERPRLKKRLTDQYSDILSESEIDLLSKQKFNDWGRLSKKFLTEIYSKDPATGNMKNIMDLLKETNQSLNKILHDEKYAFLDEIKKQNKKSDSQGVSKITYDRIDEMYISPAVKRSTWRTLSVINDVMKVTGHPPSRVFVETTREKKDTGRTTSRKQQLLNLLKSCKSSEYVDLDRITDEVNQKDDSHLRGRSLYLYYTQQCKCMYCNANLRIEDLGNKNSVNREHIYPRSKTIDDSLHNNMILVCSKCNQDKGDAYPISADIQNRMRGFWNFLKDNNFITKEKYSRLVRTTELSDEELTSFISRQLVETNQSVIAVIDVLKEAFGKESDVIYVKSRNVSEFRNENKFIKSRNVNDYHHAKDAYLNIVVGNVYDTKFTRSNRYNSKRPEHYNLAKMYNGDVSFNGKLVWQAGEDGTITTVRKYMNRNNILFTKYAFTEKGGFFDQNPLKKKATLFRRKDGLDPSKYGGYNSVKGAYFVLIKKSIGKKEEYSLESIPVHLNATNPSDEEIKKYIEEENGYKNVEIIRKVKLNSLIEVNGFRGHLVGHTGNRVRFSNGIQLLLPYELFDYCKKINNYIELSKKDRGLDPAGMGIDKNNNIVLYDCLLEKSKGEPYVEALNTLASNLDEIHEKFISASLENQTNALDKILLSFQCNSSITSLKAIGGIDNTGIIRRNKIMSRWNAESVKIIDQSPSGLFEVETEILQI